MTMPGPPSLPPQALPLDDLHGPDCFGCGHGGIAGLGMDVYQVDDEVIGDIAFGPRHAAAHGAVHGGVVAAVCDDLLSYLLFVHSELAVTRTLEVGYLCPVHVDRPYRLTARIAGREGRRLFMAAAGTRADGTTVFTAEAVFIRVDPSHFDQPGARIHPRLTGTATDGPGVAPSDGNGRESDTRRPSSIQ